MGKMHKLEIENFRVETLIAHNQYRAQHSTTPLSLSFQLCDGAQQRAEYLAETDQFERSPENQHYNESIACTWGSQLTGTLVSRMWYEEGKDYDYTRDTLSKFTQNFTQLLWKDSRELGVGRARNKHGKEIIVARYHPPGNTANFTENVLKKSDFTGLSPPVFASMALNRIPGLRQFQENCLLAHNKYRQRHRAPPLQWSYKLAYEAQKWAQHLLDSGQFTHSENIVYGENLAGRKGYDLNGKKAAKLWYDESKSFDFENPSFSPDTGNFTQLIWRGSRYFGVGKAFNNEMCIVVAYYFPPGNIVEEFEENVGVVEDNVDGVSTNETRTSAGIMAEYGQYELEKFRTEFLVFVNYLRARHASPPLTVSHLLMSNSQNWANQILRTGKISYSNDENVGESIAYAEREDLSAFKVSHRWYGEIQNHDFTYANVNPETLNFTQLVWHDSRELGVGKAVGKDGFSVVVAQYSPPGNTEGMVKQNIGKLCSPDLNEIADMKKRRYDENSNVIEYSNKKSGLSEIILPSRNEETFVFRPPSGEFNQLVWIDRSSTPSEGTKHPDVQGDAVIKEDTPDNDYESPPPSPSRSVNQIEKLLNNTTQTWETESSGEEDIDEGMEPNKPDLDEYVVLSKSTSREEIGCEEGSVYKRLSRTFSDEIEFTQQESVPEEDEPSNVSDQTQNLNVEQTEVMVDKATIILNNAKEKELKRDDEVHSPLVLRKSQQYVHHYDKEFGKIKEASIVTRPEVSEANENEDWQMIDEILNDPRSLRLSQSFDDESSPDGQRAVLRRIENENKETSADSCEDSDANLPVLEHVVTPTYARTVDHCIVDEAFDSMFTDDISEEEPEPGQALKDAPFQPESPLTPVDKQYEDSEERSDEESDDRVTSILNPIQHINITSETREYSFAVLEDLLQNFEDFPDKKVVTPVQKQHIHEPGAFDPALDQEKTAQFESRVEVEQTIVIDTEYQPVVAGALIDKVPTFVKLEHHAETETIEKRDVTTESDDEQAQFVMEHSSEYEHKVILDGDLKGEEPHGFLERDSEEHEDEFAQDVSMKGQLEEAPEDEEFLIDEAMKLKDETEIKEMETTEVLGFKEQVVPSELLQEQPIEGLIELKVEDEYKMADDDVPHRTEKHGEMKQESEFEKEGKVKDSEVTVQQQSEFKIEPEDEIEVVEQQNVTEYAKAKEEINREKEREAKEKIKVGSTYEALEDDYQAENENNIEFQKELELEREKNVDDSVAPEEPKTHENLEDYNLVQFQNTYDEAANVVEEKQDVKEEGYSERELQQGPEFEKKTDHHDEEEELDRNIDEYFKFGQEKDVKEIIEVKVEQEDERLKNKEEIRGEFNLEIHQQSELLKEQKIEALVLQEDLKGEEKNFSPFKKVQLGHDVLEEQPLEEERYSDVERQQESKLEKEPQDENDEAEKNIEEHSTVEELKLADEQEEQVLEELHSEKELEQESNLEKEPEDENDEAEYSKAKEEVKLKEKQVVKEKMGLEMDSEHKIIADDGEHGDESNLDIQQEQGLQKEQKVENAEPTNDEITEDQNISPFKTTQYELAHDVFEEQTIEEIRYSDKDLQQESKLEKRSEDKNEVEKNIDDYSKAGEDVSNLEDEQEAKEKMEKELNSKEKTLGKDNVLMDKNNFPAQPEPRLQEEQEVEGLVFADETKTDEVLKDQNFSPFQKTEGERGHDVFKEMALDEIRYFGEEIQQESKIEKELEEEWKEDESDEAGQNIDEHTKVEKSKLEDEEEANKKKELEIDLEGEMRKNDEELENVYEIYQEPALQKEQEVEGYVPAEGRKTAEIPENGKLSPFQKTGDELCRDILEEQVLEDQLHTENEFQQQSKLEKEPEDENDEAKQNFDEYSKAEKDVSDLEGEQETKEKMEVGLDSEKQTPEKYDMPTDENKFEARSEPGLQKEQEFEGLVPADESETDEISGDFSPFENFSPFEKTEGERGHNVLEEQVLAEIRYSDEEIQQESNLEKDIEDEDHEAKQNIDEYTKVEELNLEDEQEANEKMEIEVDSEGEMLKDDGEPKNVIYQQPGLQKEQERGESKPEEGYIADEEEVKNLEDEQEAKEKIEIELDSEGEWPEEGDEPGQENNFEAQKETGLQKQREVENSIRTEESKTDESPENENFLQLQKTKDELRHDVLEEQTVEEEIYSQKELHEESKLEKEPEDKNEKVEQNIDEYSVSEEVSNLEDEQDANKKMEPGKNEQPRDESNFEARQVSGSVPAEEHKTDECPEEQKFSQFRETEGERGYDVFEEQVLKQEIYSEKENEKDFKLEKEPEDENEVKAEEKLLLESKQEAKKEMKIEVESEDETLGDDGDQVHENTFEFQLEPELQKEHEFDVFVPVEEHKTDATIEDPNLSQFKETKYERLHEFKAENDVQEEEYSENKLLQELEFEKAPEVEQEQKVDDTTEVQSEQEQEDEKLQDNDVPGCEKNDEVQPGQNFGEFQDSEFEGREDKLQPDVTGEVYIEKEPCTDKELQQESEFQKESKNGKEQEAEEITEEKLELEDKMLGDFDERGGELNLEVQQQQEYTKEQEVDISGADEEPKTDNFSENQSETQKDEPEEERSVEPSCEEESEIEREDKYKKEGDIGESLIPEKVEVEDTRLEDKEPEDKNEASINADFPLQKSEQFEEKSSSEKEENVEEAEKLKDEYECERIQKDENESADPKDAEFEPERELEVQIEDKGVDDFDKKTSEKITLNEEADLQRLSTKEQLGAKEKEEAVDEQLSDRNVSQESIESQKLEFEERSSAEEEKTSEDETKEKDKQELKAESEPDHEQESIELEEQEFEERSSVEEEKICEEETKGNGNHERNAESEQDHYEQEKLLKHGEEIELKSFEKEQSLLQGDIARIDEDTERIEELKLDVQQNRDSDSLSRDEEDLEVMQEPEFIKEPHVKESLSADDETGSQHEFQFEGPEEPKELLQQQESEKESKIGKNIQATTDPEDLFCEEEPFREQEKIAEDIELESQEKQSVDESTLCQKILEQPAHTDEQKYEKKQGEMMRTLEKEPPEEPLPAEQQSAGEEMIDKENYELKTGERGDESATIHKEYVLGEGLQSCELELVSEYEPVDNQLMKDEGLIGEAQDRLKDDGGFDDVAPRSHEVLKSRGYISNEQAMIGEESMERDVDPSDVEPKSPAIFAEEQTIEKQPSLNEPRTINRQELDKKDEEETLTGEQITTFAQEAQEERTIFGPNLEQTLRADKIPQMAHTSTEAKDNLQEEDESTKHVRFSFSCEIFEEESMTISDTMDVEDDPIEDHDNKHDSQQANEEDEGEIDNEFSWVEVEKSPVLWQTVEEVSATLESETIEQQDTPVGVTEEQEGVENIASNNFPERVINIGAHALVEDIIKQAKAQSDEQCDAPFAPRLVRTESGNMVIVKLDDSGSLEERYELMEFELFEQYMKEKGTFSPFQLEFPCDVEKVFSSAQEDKPVVTHEELEYVGQGDDESDYGCERPLLASHLSIIMEEPPSGSESLSSSFQTSGIPQTSLDDDSAEYVVTSPSEFDIVHSTVREVQNKKHRAEIESNENEEDEFVPKVEDEFMVLWRSRDKNDDPMEITDAEKQSLERACTVEQETMPCDSEVSEVTGEEEKVDINLEKKDYLKLDLGSSPDVHSESSVSPGSSVRSWVSSDLSSLDDETTSKGEKGYMEGAGTYTNEEKETVGFHREVSRSEQGNIEVAELGTEKPMVSDLLSDDGAAYPESNKEMDILQEQASSAQLANPPDPNESDGKYGSLSIEEDGDKKITEVVKTETTRKIVKIVDGKEVPLEDEELEYYESGMLEKEGTSDQPVFTTGKLREKEISKTITTVVTRKQDMWPVLTWEGDKSAPSDTLNEMKAENFQAEPVVHIEKQEDDGVRKTITTVVTQKIEKGPSSEIDYQTTGLEKQDSEGFEASEDNHPKGLEKDDEESKMPDDEATDFPQNIDCIDKERTENETKDMTEELKDGLKRITTTRITKTVERSPEWNVGNQGCTAMDILKKMGEDDDDGETEMTTEELEENGGKTTITRITRRKEIGEPVLMSEEQYREMLRQSDAKADYSADGEPKPVLLDVTEQGDGIVTQTVTKVVSRTMEKEPSLAIRDEGGSMEDLLQKLKERESSRIFSATRSDNDTEKTHDNAEELRLEGEVKISHTPTEEKVSYEVTEDEDGTMTTITRIETGISSSKPVMLDEQHDVMKDVLERTHQVVLQAAPMVEYEEHGEGDVVREVRREVREVTTMETTSELGDFQARVILEHNKCRYIHYAKPVTWSDKLAKEAQIWAEHLAESGCLKHSTSPEYGENVAYSSEILNGYDLSQLWYDEIRHYSFIKPGFSTQTAHFTQMVWAGTKEMGVGMALAPDGTSYYVARYQPPGNKLGCFDENVLSPRESAVEGRPRKKKSPSPPSPPNEIETIKHDCLVTHNYHRFQHGASELTWSPTLAVEALHGAEKLIRNGSIQGSDTNDRGENIAISSNRSFDVKAAIELWYKEEKDYNYSSPAFSSLTRNFSQMIWKECKEVGMALARSDDGNLVVVVARYYPAGNTVGMFQDNVLSKSDSGGDISS